MKKSTSHLSFVSTDALKKSPSSATISPSSAIQRSPSPAQKNDDQKKRKFFEPDPPEASDQDVLVKLDQFLEKNNKNEQSFFSQVEFFLPEGDSKPKKAKQNKRKNFDLLSNLQRLRDSGAVSRSGIM